MIAFDNITKSMHKHMFELVVPTYYCHFSKLSFGTEFTELLWIQPLWGTIPIFPFCPNIIKMTLRCSSVIKEDPLLTKLRTMADFVTKIYSPDGNYVPNTIPVFPDPYSVTNKIPLYLWNGTDIINNTPFGEATTFIQTIVELPISPLDTVAAININVNILVCCF